MLTGPVNQLRLPQGLANTTKLTVYVGRSERIAGPASLCGRDAANPSFQLVSSRYEHASLILTSNLLFSGWGGVFGDQAVAAAMIDRIVHHADVLTLKGAGYATVASRPCPASAPKTRQTKNRRTGGPIFSRRFGPDSRAVDTAYSYSPKQPLL
jgi:IstB-like ATP binding protein